MMNDFYTYAYMRKDRTPYYIGKGRGKRIYSKNRRVNPPKDKSRIIFLKQNLTEEEAFKHEIYMIAVFGRKDLETGILHNMTDGGEGASGRIVTEEYRKKISASLTFEQRSEISRKVKASMTPEQRREATRKGRANMTPEQRSEVTRKGRANMTPEQRREAARKGKANMTPEQRSEAVRKANASRTPEQRSEVTRKGRANMTPEQRSEISRKANASRTPEQRSEAARKRNFIKFQCTMTGYISNSGALSRYQKARGIDTSKRIKLS